MRIALQVVSWAALAAVVIPSVSYLGGGMELPAVKTIMIVGTVVWFLATPFWMGREEDPA